MFADRAARTRDVLAPVYIEDEGDRRGAGGITSTLAELFETTARTQWYLYTGVTET